MTYEVRRLEPQTTLTKINLLYGVIGKETPNHITWGIFKNGEIVQSSMGDLEIYPSKRVAERQAEYLNKRELVQ